MDTPLDLVEEATGDAGFDAGRGMEGDGDTVGDGLLIPCQIGDDRVKRQAAEVLPEFGKVAALVRPGPLETRDKIAEQGQVGVVAGRTWSTAAVTWTMPWAPQSAASRGMST